MSFFDDGEDTAPRPSPRAPRRPAGERGSTGQRRPRPRRPASAGGHSGYDQHTLMVRRRVAAGVAVVVLILIVLLINGCLKSQKQQSLKDYNRHVGEIASEFETQVGTPLFAALAGASGKSDLEAQSQVNNFEVEARKLAGRAKELSVPGEMAGAQRDLLLALDLRVEGLTKVAALLPAALGGQNKQQATTKIAGDMEMFLASDVIYSQRVAPLIQQTLAANGIQESTKPGGFLPNLGWLEQSTVQARLTGQSSSSSSSSGAVQPGHHGSVLKGVSVGGTALETEPALNHVSGGGNQTFSVSVEDDGEFTESDVKVDLTVTAAGKEIKESHTISTTEPGKTAKAEIAVSGIPLGVAAKIEATVEPVPGETNHEGTKGTFVAIFSG